MVNKSYSESDIQSIANAIRVKLNTDMGYYVSEMADAILSITSTSGVSDVSVIPITPSYIQYMFITGGYDRDADLNSDGSIDSRDIILCERLLKSSNQMYVKVVLYYDNNSEQSYKILIDAPEIDGYMDTSEGTASAQHILSPYIAYVAGEEIVGTMADKSTTEQYSTNRVDVQNSGVCFFIPNNGYYSTSNKIYRANSDLANDLGITASKIVAGNTVLGIPGTGGSIYEDGDNIQF